MMHIALTISDHKFTVTNLIVQGVGQDFSNALISFARLVYKPLKSERFTA